jgi:hypothetical protein
MPLAFPDIETGTPCCVSLPAGKTVSVVCYVSKLRMTGGNPN